MAGDQPPASQPVTMSKAQRTLEISRVKREDLFSRLQSFYDVSKTLTNANYITYGNMLSRVYSLRERFDSIQWEIIELNTYFPASEQLEVNAVSKAFEEMAQKIEVTFEKLGGLPKESVPATAAGTTAAPARSVKLPRLQLTQFSGKTEDWLTFSNVFTVSVHSVDTLSPIDKFRYLLSVLEGDALSLVKSLDLTSANYVVAWDLLRTRYHNERRLISHHLNHILDMDEIKNNASSVSQFLVQYREHSQALCALKRDLGQKNDLLVAVLLRKLPTYLRKHLEDYRGMTTEFPTVDEILKFLEKECVHLEETGSNQKSSPNPQKSSRALITSHEGQKPSAFKKFSDDCPLCKSNHPLRRCVTFLSKTVKERQEFVKKAGCCQNCLAKHPIGQTCFSKNTCSICNRKHHSLLHFSNTNNESQQQKGNTATSPKQNAVLSTLSRSRPQRRHQILMATTLVRLVGPRGRTYIARGILDSAAQRTLITTRTAKLLRLRYQPQTATLSGLSQTPVGIEGSARVHIWTLNSEPVSEDHEVDILHNITAPLPDQRVSSTLRSKIGGLKLADPQFDRSSPIDLLIGADLMPYVITGAPITLGPGFPVAIPTRFGTVLMGKVLTSDGPTPANDSVALLSVANTGLHDAIQRFWQLEESPLMPHFSEDEALAEECFVKQHTRNKNGKYIVRIPRKPDHPPLGESRAQALRRFHALDRSLVRKPKLKSQYHAFMKDYETSEHMVLCDKMPAGDHFFLPHHGITKESSSTTKLRVVFDAAAKSSTGVTLNDIQLVGPKLHADIKHVLNNFRRYPIVFSCDVKQMYRCIEVHPDDQALQLIFWRTSPDEPIRMYKLTTVTFGLTSSRFLALRTTRQLAEDDGDDFPLAVEIITEETFVDDILSGGFTPEEVKQKRDNLIGLFERGDFKLRKWKSDDPNFLGELPVEDLELPTSWGDASAQAYSVLGLKWLPKEDVFTYAVNNASPKPITKRGAMSTICSIFDPLGFLAPVAFIGKSLIQQLWLLKLAWDDLLPPEISKQWTTFLGDLPTIEGFRVPRLIPGLDKAIQVHGFCDASERGYAAVAYLRTTTADGGVQARTRVAPLKMVSLPRLELCGADLLATLLKDIIPQITSKIQIEEIRACGDATIALAWIQTPPHKLQTFVANRVSNIQETHPDLVWGHVKSKDNSADIASRGALPSELLSNELWLHGPEWLALPPARWPKTPINHSTDLPEMKLRPPLICVVHQPQENLIINLEKMFILADITACLCLCPALHFQLSLEGSRYSW